MGEELLTNVDLSLRERLKELVKEYNSDELLVSSTDEVFSLISDLLEYDKGLVSKSKKLFFQNEKLKDIVKDLEQKDSIFMDVQKLYNPHEALELASKFCKEKLGADRVTLWWYNSSKNRLSNHIAEGIANHNEFNVPLKNTLAGYSYTENKVVNISDAYNIKDEVPFKYQKGFDKKNHYRTKSVLCVPISYVNASTGETETAVLQLINKNKNIKKNVFGESFTKDDVRIARNLGFTIFSGLKDHAAVRELESAHNSSLVTLVKTIDARHPYTAGHSLRVQEMSEKLGIAYGLAGRDLVTLGQAAILHDIGKMGIPDRILFKSGKLTNPEFEFMKKHPSIGKNIISGMTIPNKKIITDAIESHHEKLNGFGYPNGVGGDDVSLYARILGISDIFDALRSYREYRDPLTTVETIGGELISHCVRKNELDSDLLKLFIKNDCYITSGYDSLFDGQLLKEKDLIPLNKRPNFGNQSVIESYHHFVESHGLPKITSDLEKKATQFDVSIAEIREHESLKDYFLNMIDDENYWVRVKGDTGFNLSDMLDIMSSQKYTNNPISLGDFFTTVIPKFMKKGWVSSDEVLTFLDNEEWRNLKSNNSYNVTTKFKISDISLITKLLDNSHCDSITKKNFVERKKYLKKNFSKTHKIKQHELIKSYFSDLYSSIFDSTFQGKGSGFLFNDVYNILTGKDYIKRSYKKEEVFFLVGYDALTKKKVTEKVLSDNLFYRCGFDSKNISKIMTSFSKHIKRKTKHVKYDYKFLKKLNGFQKYFIANQEMDLNQLSDYWYSKIN